MMEKIADNATTEIPGAVALPRNASAIFRGKRARWSVLSVCVIGLFLTSNTVARADQAADIAAIRTALNNFWYDWQLVNYDSQSDWTAWVYEIDGEVIQMRQLIDLFTTQFEEFRDGIREDVQYNGDTLADMDSKLDNIISSFSDIVSAIQQNSGSLSTLSSQLAGMTSQLTTIVQSFSSLSLQLATQLTNLSSYFNQLLNQNQTQGDRVYQQLTNMVHETHVTYYNFIENQEIQNAHFESLLSALDAGQGQQNLDLSAIVSALSALQTINHTILTNITDIYGVINYISIQLDLYWTEYFRVLQDDFLPYYEDFNYHLTNFEDWGVFYGSYSNAMSSVASGDFMRWKENAFQNIASSPIAAMMFYPAAMRWMDEKVKIDSWNNSLLYKIAINTNALDKVDDNGKTIRDNVSQIARDVSVIFSNATSSAGIGKWGPFTWSYESINFSSPRSWTWEDGVAIHQIDIPQTTNFFEFAVNSIKEGFKLKGHELNILSQMYYFMSSNVTEDTESRLDKITELNSTINSADSDMQAAINPLSGLFSSFVPSSFRQKPEQIIGFVRGPGSLPTQVSVHIPAFGSIIKDQYLYIEVDDNIQSVCETSRTIFQFIYWGLVFLLTLKFGRALFKSSVGLVNTYLNALYSSGYYRQMPLKI